MQRAPLTPGTLFGELEIVRVLADGGFGIVYLARDHALDRDVAIKEFMPAQLVERSQGLQVTVQAGTGARAFEVGLRAFIEEAKLLASFSHPAVVKVYRFWEANGTGYMMMPHLLGPTLSDVRRSMSEPPTETWIRSMIEPLLDALALLHSRGVCHRDVAPDNVIVTGPGQPVLLDFGAARRLIGHSKRPVTAVVKPSYAPIEQYAEAAHLQQGPWTDLYGLAALVAYLIDGSPPPAATTRCVHDEMAPLGRRRIAGVSPRFLATMDWALAVRPQDRPHSVAALREALDGRHSVRLARWRHGTTWLWRRVGWALSPKPGVASGKGARRWSPYWAPLGAAAVLLALGAGSRATLESVLVRPTASHEPGRVAATAVPTTVTPTVAPTTPPTTASVVTPAPASPPVDVALKSPPAKEPYEEFITATGEPTAAPAVTPARAAARRPPHKNVRKAPEIESVAAGPRELCAERNFFLRPYCVQRMCGDPRFKKRAECAPAPPRNDHY